jgi:acyl-CoA thioester hydrolase
MSEPMIFEWPVRVYWEDTDAGGVVYYANYLKFIERARTEWLSALGLEQDWMARELGILFVVRRVEADYLRPARFNDRLRVHSRLVELGRVSMVMEQQVLRGGETLLGSRVQIACVGRDDFRPARIPRFVTDRLHP